MPCPHTPARSGRQARRHETRALIRRNATLRSASIAPTITEVVTSVAPTITEVVTSVESIRQRINADLQRYGIEFSAEYLLNEPTVQDTLRFEIARALDGERVQLMIMHHAFNAESVVTSVDEWLKRWPQRMALYLDVNRYVN